MMASKRNAASAALYAQKLTPKQVADLKANTTADPDMLKSA